MAEEMSKREQYASDGNADSVERIWHIQLWLLTNKRTSQGHKRLLALPSKWPMQCWRKAHARLRRNNDGNSKQTRRRRTSVPECLGRQPKPRHVPARPFRGVGNAGVCIGAPANG